MDRASHVCVFRNTSSSLASSFCDFSRSSKVYLTRVRSTQNTGYGVMDWHLSLDGSSATFDFVGTRRTKTSVFSSAKRSHIPCTKDR